MKIAYVYDAVYPFVKGGVEKRVYEIGRRLARKHEVHWFSLNWDGELDDILVHRVGNWKRFYHGDRRSIGEALYFAQKLLLKFGGEYDIVDCQEFPYFSCFSTKLHSILKRTPLVLTWHEVWDGHWYEYLGKLGGIGRRVERLTTRLTPHNIAVSRFTQKRLLRFGVPSRVIPNGIDFEKIRSVPRLEGVDYDVLFVGRLIREKNVELLVRAVQILKTEIPDIKVLIIGDGPERRRLERLSEELNLVENVDFKGFLDEYEAVISHMKASRVFVLPSIREGFGITALEANASGIPVVTVVHPLNAAAELIVHEYNGFLAFPNPGSLAESILVALDHGKKLKRNCVRYARNYDWDNITRLIENFYERVADDS